MSLSLDGFVADADGGKDWLFKTGDEESLAWSVERIREAGLIIMGRKSFEMMSPYWPTATGPFAAPMNEIPKAVFTRSGFVVKQPRKKATGERAAAKASWTGARVFNINLAEAIKTLKTEAGNPIVAIGGAEFAQSLIATGLVDEYNLGIHPVVLGSGLQIFSQLKKPIYMKLRDIKAFPKGAVAHTYAV